jgi:hypothetical protein
LTAIAVASAVVHDFGLSRRKVEPMKRPSVGETHLGQRMSINRKKISPRCLPLVSTELEHAHLIVTKAARCRREDHVPVQSAGDAESAVVDPPRDPPPTNKESAKIENGESHNPD